MYDYNIGEVERFKYLGCVLRNYGDLKKNTKHRIKFGWTKWKEASGVLCDKIISIRLKDRSFIIK